MKTLAGPTQLGYFTEGMMNAKILKAQCKRMAGRATIIGNTAFKFDRNGICRIANEANVSLDFKVLCRQNGVIELDPETEQPIEFSSKEPMAPVKAVVGPGPTEDELSERAAGKEVQAAESAAMDLLDDGPPDLVVPAAKEEAPPVEKSKPVDKDKSRKPADKK